MSENYSPREGGKLYLPLVRKAERVINRMTAKWGVNCDIYHCKNNINDLDIYGINTNELKYDIAPDLNAKLVLPAVWENYGVKDFNTGSHSSEELEDSIYTLPAVKIPILSKIVVREGNTNRVYIVRKTILEHFNQAELYLQYVLDIMPSDDALSQVEDLDASYEDMSIFNQEQSNTNTEDLLPPGISIKPIRRY